MAKNITSRTIVFVHGMFMNPKSWGGWEAWFASRGFTCHSPAFPFHHGEPSALRRNISLELGKLRFGETIDTLARFIDTLPEKPILIGHSMGGLAVQKLLSLGKGAAAVAIDPAPPSGISSFRWSFLKSNFPVINPLRGDAPFLPSVKWFQKAFCNTMTLERTAAEYEKYVVPESRNLPRSSTGEEGGIDFRKPHPPLLFIAGEKDQIIPKSLVRKNFRAYREGVKDWKEFEGRTHYLCNQDNWEEIAEFVLGWIKDEKERGRASIR